MRPIWRSTTCKGLRYSAPRPMQGFVAFPTPLRAWPDSPATMIRRAWIRTTLVSLLGLAIPGCGTGDDDYRDADAPRFVAPPPDSPSPRIAFVLGSGDTRGVLHIRGMRA